MAAWSRTKLTHPSSGVPSAKSKTCDIGINSTPAEVMATRDGVLMGVGCDGVGYAKWSEYKCLSFFGGGDIPSCSFWMFPE